MHLLRILRARMTLKSVGSVLWGLAILTLLGSAVAPPSLAGACLISFAVAGAMGMGMWWAAIVRQARPRKGPWA